MIKTMKIIQIVTIEDEDLIALTDNGRIFTGYWKQGTFYWNKEITPNMDELMKLPQSVKYDD